RVRAEDDTALVDALLILDGAFLGNARSDEGAEKAARRAARARARERGCERTGDDETEAWEKNVGADGSDAADYRAKRPADGAADAHAFKRLRALLVFHPVETRIRIEVALAGVIRHEDADVVGLVAVTRRQVRICALGVLGPVVESRHEARAIPL